MPILLRGIKNNTQKSRVLINDEQEINNFVFSNCVMSGGTHITPQFLLFSFPRVGIEPTTNDNGIQIYVSLIKIL